MDEISLRRYAELVIRVGLNLQPGQRLLIIGPLANGGVALDAAPLVRAVSAQAYDAGAPLVEVLWGDEALVTLRFRHAPPESFGQASAWLPGALLEHVQAGHASLSIYANDPDLLRSAPPERVSAIQSATAHAVKPFRDSISKNATNWCVVAAPAASWAARVFPGLPEDEQVARLSAAIARLCRLDAADPVAAWQSHLDGLAARTVLLNARRYDALRYRGPGTDLRVGLAAGHIWTGGRSTSANGIPFAANLPTEEVFTMPARDRVDGHVRASKPLSYGGTLIEDFSFTFEAGRIVDVRAARGQEVLRQLVATDAGRRPPRRDRARAAQLTGFADRPPVLQHALRRERRQPPRHRLGVHVHARGRRSHVGRGVRARRRQPQRHARRLHDRVGRTGHRRRAAPTARPSP